MLVDNPDHPYGRQVIHQASQALNFHQIRLFLLHNGLQLLDILVSKLLKIVLILFALIFAKLLLNLFDIVDCITSNVANSDFSILGDGFGLLHECFASVLC